MLWGPCPHSITQEAANAIPVEKKHLAREHSDGQPHRRRKEGKQKKSYGKEKEKKERTEKKGRKEKKRVAMAEPLPSVLVQQLKSEIHASAIMSVL